MPDVPRSDQNAFQTPNRLGVQTIRKHAENQWQQVRWRRKKNGNSDGGMTSVETVTAWNRDRLDDFWDGVVR